MKKSVTLTVGLVATTLLLSACASPAWNNDDALECVRLEVQVDRHGNMTEVEHHIDPQKVPQAVRDAMDALHPGGPYTDAEKEINAGVTYYELNRVVDGLEVEAMFSVDGRLHSEEIQIPATKVPAAVKAAAAGVVAGGTVTAWEEIRDGERRLVEYHVKIDGGGKKWKAAISVDGQVLGVWREVVAEIEVPR